MLGAVLVFLTLLNPLEKLAAAGPGIVGVAVVHIESGQRLAVRGGERFAMHSVFKLPIAIELLARVDAGKVALDRKIELVEADRRRGPAHGLGERLPGTFTVSQLLEAMIIESDSTACDKLLALMGGPRVVGERMRELGVPDIIVDRTEKELAEGKAGDTATPDEMAALLEKLVREQLGLSKGSAALLDDLLGRVRTGAARIPAGVPAGVAVRHKTGTSGTYNGVTAATNDVGVLTLPDGTHLVVAVFLRDARGDAAQRDAVIAGIVKEAYAWALASAAR